MIFITFLSIALGLVSTLSSWARVVQWVRDDLVPWLTLLDPSLGHCAATALAWIDNHVATPLLVLIKQAWTRLRQRVLDLVVEITEGLPGHWQRIVKILFIDPLRPQQVRMRKCTTIDISWEELPESAREHFRTKRSTFIIAAAELRQQEIESFAFNRQCSSLKESHR